jgi:hypothetical protein
MGAYISLTQLVNVVSMRKTELNYPVNQNFMQLTKKIKKLEKALKKSRKKKKSCYEDSNSDSE